MKIIYNFWCNLGKFLWEGLSFILEEPEHVRHLRHDISSLQEEQKRLEDRCEYYANLLLTKKRERYPNIKNYEQTCFTCGKHYEPKEVFLMYGLWNGKIKLEECEDCNDTRDQRLI